MFYIEKEFLRDKLTTWYRDWYNRNMNDTEKRSIDEFIGRLEKCLPVEAQVGMPSKTLSCEQILQKFLEWNKKYPPKNIYGYSAINRITDELTQIMEDAQKYFASKS